MTRASVRTIKTSPAFIGSKMGSEGIYVIAFFFFFLTLI